MKLSLGVVTSQPLNDSLKYAKKAEHLGFKRVWVGEDITSREVFTYLSIIALKTSSIGLASGITSPYLRSITVLASSSAGVHQLSGGRFALGIGPGGLPEVKKVTGSKPHNVVDVMRESTTVLRRIFNEERVSYDGGLICLEDYQITHEDVKPLEIHFGVRGPRLLALAGEIADGIIFSGPLGYLSHSLKIVKISAKRAKRDPKKIRKTLWNPFILGKEIKSARPMVATMIASLPENALEYIEIESKTLIEIRRLFALSRYEDAYSLVDSRLIGEFLVAGNKKDIDGQVDRYKRLGFDELILGPPYGEDPLKAIEDMDKRWEG